MMGISREIAMVAFRPGRAPITMPPTTPITSAIRLSKERKFDITVDHISFSLLYGILECRMKVNRTYRNPTSPQGIRTRSRGFRS